MTDDFEPTPSIEGPEHGSSGPEPVSDAIVPPQSRGSLRRSMLVIVSVIVLAVVAVAGVRANAVWGRHAMMLTGATAAQALVEGRALELAAVSNAAVRSGLTTATASAMRDRGVLGEFSAPAWTGDVGTVTVTTAMGAGQLVLQPADGADVVTFRTGGAIGLATGAITMQRTWSGWVVSGLTVAPIEAPPLPTATTATPAP